VLNDLLNQNPDRFIPLFIFTSGYTTPWGIQRDAFYNVTGIPSVWYDGLFDAYYEGWAQGYPYPYTGYMPVALDERLLIPTDVTIDVQVAGAGDTWRATATVCIEPGGTGRDLRVHMVRYLDWYPTVYNYYRNCVMEGHQMPDITLAAGECAQVEQAFVLDANSLVNPDNVGIAVFAQDPLAGAPAEVQQAGQQRAPFPGVFMHGFEDGTANGWLVMP